VELFDSGQSPQPNTFIKRRGAQFKGVESVIVDDERVALRASLKLGIGDVTGAVNVLSSDCTYVAPDVHTYNVLLTKHPPTPCPSSVA